MLLFNKHYYKRILLFIMIIVLFSSAYAIDMPFFNYDHESDIIFADSVHQELLYPLIDEVLKANYLKRKNAQLDLGINKQARFDRESIEKLLRSKGFYSAKVKYEVIDDKIEYHITADKPYIIEQISIKSSFDNIPSTDSLGLKKGSRFEADAVLSVISKLRKHIEQNYCSWKINVDYDATINHKDKTAKIILIIEDSTQLNLNIISIEGLKKINNSYIEKKLGLKSGDCFKRSQIEKARLNLFETGLVSGVDTKFTKHDELVDIEFDITERKHRTIKLGGGVNSDEGVVLSAGWEHRNIFGAAQKLQVNTKFSEVLRTINADLDFPSFLSEKQNLILEADISEENFEAYDSKGGSVSARLKRKLTKYLSGSVGSKFSFIQADENGDGVNEDFALLSFPVSIEYDKRDNILDPRHGWRIGAEISPFLDTLDTSRGFVKTSLGASAYHTFEKAKFTPTIAVRGATGSINGLDTDDIPITERFYAGGGGSVRGYAFQKLGPLEADEIPTGGRSFSEVSFETRAKFSPKWGGVLFVDGGNAYNDITPDFDEGMRFAYGGGVRYYTDFAPLRLDIAIPIDRRDGIDDSFQFYISIGQAF